MNSTMTLDSANRLGNKVAAPVANMIDADYSVVSPRRSAASVLLLDGRMLDRECFRQTLRAHDAQIDVLAFSTPDEWFAEKELYPQISVALLNLGGRRVTDATVAKEIADLIARFAPIPVVVLADSEDLNHILKVLESGAKGYIPSSVGMNVCVEAIRLAMAGGTFVPASSVMAMSKAIEAGDVSRPMAGMFTPRQAEVVMALRQGKANKIIAYELNLRESTVKVHIRNIMRKLKATNRTEVAYKISDLFPREFGRIA